MKKLLTFLTLFLMLGGVASADNIEKAHEQYKNRMQGYKSSHLIHFGKTRGDDYKNCLKEKYHKDKDPHDFCSWHAGIGKYSK
jgi:hypothetical protein